MLLERMDEEKLRKIIEESPLDETRLRRIIRETVRDEMDEFYKKLAHLLEQKAGGPSQAEKEVLGLIGEGEVGAEELAVKKKVSREAIVQICQKLWSEGYIDKLREGKKIKYRIAKAEE